MDDMKDKFKGFMKKVNTLSSSSSGKFKGQGRVLGSSSESVPSNPIHARYNQTQNPNPKPNPKPQPQPQPLRPSSDYEKKPQTSGGYDSFTSSSQDARSFECPICNGSFRSEEEVSDHVEICIGAESKNEVELHVAAFLSAGKPVDVVLRLLSNIVKEPENVKFRKIRMSNPKIKEAVGEVTGGVELLKLLGFQFKEEDGEMWASMELPTQEQIGLISAALALLEPKNKTEPVEPKKVDRQIRVFFAVSESEAAKIELPDSFYKLSVQELKREADMRKKKIDESQLLIPKSYKEKQAKAARKRYTRTVIRIQFPDGVVLQGCFHPEERTTALYEFVSSALKEGGLQFELLDPVPVRRRVLPGFGAEAKGLDEEGLVPSALIKFKPIETDSVVFTGVSNDLLQIMEPLVNASAVPTV